MTKVRVEEITFVRRDYDTDRPPLEQLNEYLASFDDYDFKKIISVQRADVEYIHPGNRSTWISGTTYVITFELA